MIEKFPIPASKNSEEATDENQAETSNVVSIERENKLERQEVQELLDEIHETITSAEIPPQLKEAVLQGVDHAINQIGEKYEQGDPNTTIEYLNFHGKFHTAEITARVLRLGQELGLPMDKVAKAALAAAFHDIDQTFTTEVNEKTEIEMLKRDIGPNEKRSADQAVAYMQEQNVQAGAEIFTEEDIRQTRMALDGTIPSFGPVEDPEKEGDNKDVFTVIQAERYSDIDPAYDLVRISDLLDAGLGGPESYLEAGDALYKEERVEMKRFLSGELEFENDNALQEFTDKYEADMRGWALFQPQFGRGQELLFPDSTSQYSEEQKTILLEKANRFQESIAAAQERGQRRSTMSFKELVNEIYGVELSPDLARAA